MNLRRVFAQTGKEVKKMEIKKISDKINFDVEAQCTHGESSTKGGCHADCKKTRWISASLVDAIQPNRQAVLQCKMETYYTCSWACSF